RGKTTPATNLFYAVQHRHVRVAGFPHGVQRFANLCTLKHAGGENQRLAQRSHASQERPVPHLTGPHLVHRDIQRCQKLQRRFVMRRGKEGDAPAAAVILNAAKRLVGQLASRKAFTPLWQRAGYQRIHIEHLELNSVCARIGGQVHQAVCFLLTAEMRNTRFGDHKDRATDTDGFTIDLKTVRKPHRRHDVVGHEVWLQTQIQ
ncbi:hypothetical protein C9890_0335, partial [Perkinsus sp. BL_2016]